MQTLEAGRPQKITRGIEGESEHTRKAHTYYVRFGRTFMHQPKSRTGELAMCDTATCRGLPGRRRRWCRATASTTRWSCQSTQQLELKVTADTLTHGCPLGKWNRMTMHACQYCSVHGEYCTLLPLWTLQRNPITLRRERMIGVRTRTCNARAALDKHYWTASSSGNKI